MSAVTSLLDRPTYLYAEVDRLVGLRSGTARRWINGYERGGRSYEPILRVRGQDTEWASWGEFVETRMLAEYREQNVPTARLRAAVERLRDTFRVNYPLAHLRPYLAAENNELAISAGKLHQDEDGLVVVRTGQLILQSGRNLFETATLAADADGEKFATEVPLDPDFPGIKVHPDRLSGQPTFEGRRIAIATIASLVVAGEAREDIAADFKLSLAQVRAAEAYTSKHKLVVA